MAVLGEGEGSIEAILDGPSQLVDLRRVRHLLDARGVTQAKRAAEPPLSIPRRWTYGRYC